MKTWTRNAIAAALAATIGLAGGAAFARGGPGCDGEGGGRQAMHQQRDPAAMQQRAQQRLAALHQALALQPAQAEAWKTFEATLRERFAQGVAHRQAMREAGRPATALERMARMEQSGEQRLKAMQETRRAVETFYATLDTTQKQTFDTQFRMPGMDGQGHRGGKGGMGPGGMMQPQG